MEFPVGSFIRFQATFARCLYREQLQK
ncbi:hypothetical protein TSAR_009741 [Trichomalopsis sarcophagae]|uniref:Uncharacterized protein n=1 Tax=Trichomalopsis sarcophagae TaxID=543379 RepID=A0A232EIF9_9HYME|nr:hypothetical protein TSAR_009741 [Trichomalopsis sarcophagae]